MSVVRRIAFALAAVLAAPSAAGAQQTPCTGCAIANAQAAAQMRANQTAVQSTLQNTLNAQLQAQASSLQAQALLRSLQQANALNAGTQELRQLLILQQLQLLQIQQRSAKGGTKGAPAKAAPLKAASGTH